MPQAELDEVLDRLLAPAGEVTASASADDGEAQQAPALPEGAAMLKDDLARAGFELAGLFSHKETDTQAFLAISGSGSEVSATKKSRF